MEAEDPKVDAKSAEESYTDQEAEADKDENEKEPSQDEKEV